MSKEWVTRRPGNQHDLRESAFSFTCSWSYWCTRRPDPCCSRSENSPPFTAISGTFVCPLRNFVPWYCHIKNFCVCHLQIILICRRSALSWSHYGTKSLRMNRKYTVPVLPSATRSVMDYCTGSGCLQTARAILGKKYLIVPAECHRKMLTIAHESPLAGHLSQNTGMKVGEVRDLHRHVFANLVTSDTAFLFKEVRPVPLR